MQVIAHRGASDICPENTMPAVAAAIECGADAVELDIRQTFDGHWVCLHDASLLRTTGVNKPVSKTTLQELRQLDAGKWKDSKFEGAGIPLLRDILEQYVEDVTFYLEIKEKKLSDSSVKQLKDLVISRGSRIVFISFHAEVLHQIKMPDSGLRYDLLLSSKMGLDRKLNQWENSMDAGESGVGIHYRLMDDDRIKRRCVGFNKHVFTADTPSIWNKCVAPGFDGITTNKPGALKQWLDNIQTLGD